MPKQFRHACHFLENSEKIASCLTAIERNQQLMREIRSALPSPLDEHCIHASLEAGVMTLVTDSPVWSTRLRFFAPELERRLALGHRHITGWRVRVQPPVPSRSPAQGSASKHKLSPATTRHLLEAASGIADPRVAEALRRLAKAGAKDS